MKHDFAYSMIDGKAVNAIHKVPSSHSCGTCAAKKSHLCDDNLVDFSESDTLEKSLPVLHSWIRFMSFVLNNVYRKKLDTSKEKNKKMINIKSSKMT